MSKSNPLEVRNLSFALSEGIPRTWHRRGRAVTAFWNSLSISFPAGERFVISSVKANRDAIRDPDLARTVQLFYAQEGIHSREHQAFNDRLQAQGYPADVLEEQVEAVFRQGRQNSSAREQLAATAALEHITAVLADWVLAQPALMEEADPRMAAVFRWHAAEETEHKAVAFDVFEHVGGTYTERAGAMLSATYLFVRMLVRQQIALMRVDDTLTSLSEWRTLARYLFSEGKLHQRLLPPLLAYFRPSFHPWQHDNRDKLEAWKREHAESALYAAAE